MRLGFLALLCDDSDYFQFPAEAETTAAADDPTTTPASSIFNGM